MAIKIMLDAGHYGERNQSTVYPSYYESKQMWKLHLLLKKWLEKYGFEVGTTRSNQEKDLAVYDRGKKAKGYNLLLSLHSDASDSESTSRATAFYAFDDFNNASKLAEKLSHAVGLCMGVSGKIKTRKSENANTDYYGVMRGARAVGCPLYFIIEHSFHTNKDSAKWLMSDSNLDKLAKAEADVIAEYYGVKKVEEPKTEEKAEEKTEPKAEANVYFKKYTGDSSSIVSALKSIGENSSYEYRAKIAAANGITNYSGTAEQNSTMRKLLKAGKLIKPTEKSVTYFKKYNGDSVSIVNALNVIGANSTFAYRKTIAEANNIKAYKGTAAQNKQMLNLLKQGKLIKP